jgi:hypothetical protein
MNTLIQVDVLTMGCKAEMVNAKIITECNISVDIEGFIPVYLASTIPSIGGTSISAVTPDFIWEGIQTTSLVA